MTTQHLMLVPSLSCPAECKYCFGPHEGNGFMDQATLKAVVDWQRTKNAWGSLEITFHGGEPLTVGSEFYRKGLPLLKTGMSPQKVRFAIQSNLWLLTDEICQIFKDHEVSIGTSLDGPEPINDAQRGTGYFRRTMKGIDLARSHGLSVGCICTFTGQSAQYSVEIFDFFVREGLRFSIHAALPSLQSPAVSQWHLSPEAHGDILVQLLDRYLDNLDKLRIPTLDSLARGISAQQGGICTFSDCLGHYLAVGPDGAIYPCQRFAGTGRYALGNVHERSSEDDLSRSPVWKMFQDHQDHITQECGECTHFAYCRGGCPYNTLALSGGGFKDSCRDPHCKGYQRIFIHIINNALAEVFSEHNMASVVKRPDKGFGLLRHGRLLKIMRNGPHPYTTTQQAVRILVAVTLASTGSLSDATRFLHQLGLFHSVEGTEAALGALWQRLTRPNTILNNLYLHVTLACNLRCTHCYAESGSGTQEFMSVAEAIQVCQDASKLGFRKLVLTGGEPLVHPQRSELLDTIGTFRKLDRSMRVVLRTNLAVAISDELWLKLTRSVDEIVVSLDGSRDTHDERRGKGSYDLTIGNLARIAEMPNGPEVSLASVLSESEIVGAPGESVLSLARQLNIRRVRFRPLLPLGRAADCQMGSCLHSAQDIHCPETLIDNASIPGASCGIGHNLYVKPDGSVYPCYALCHERWRIGSLLGSEGLTGVIASKDFEELIHHTVNTNRSCRKCALRYLCGGGCKAWAVSQGLESLDAPLGDCSPLYARAYSVFEAARIYLDISEETWFSSGLFRDTIPPSLFQRKVCPARGGFNEIR